MARIRSASHYERQPLARDWQFAELSGGALPTTPSELEALAPAWIAAQVPGTVASSLRALNAWDFGSPRNFDAADYWYRLRFASTPAAPGESMWLAFGGLATLADVWLNGQHLLRSENMFRAHDLDVSTLIGNENELLVRFSSLDTASALRRPRPRFKTRLIERQQLRWFRTTLLGRIPGWSPPVAAVGPWREVSLERRRGPRLLTADVRPQVERGRASVSARFVLSEPVTSATFHVGSEHTELALSDGGTTLGAELTLPNAELWWPHSHGAQPRYEARLTLESAGGRHEFGFDPLAFRSLRVETAGDAFTLVINDEVVRCRGACWTPSDVVSLGDDQKTIATVQQAHAAGMNMLRVGGTMIYESEAFYEECDRSGVLVWQDFMFANCDYPSEDAAFAENVRLEAEQFLARTRTRACLAVLCGNSEIEQQMAMLGLPRETWKPPLFEHTLRAIASEQRPDVPYVSSTPTGGALPFQPNAGLTHYYGVGAYLRPLSDARRADLKFTPECLGFANIPEESTLLEVLGDGRAPFHDPAWKARVPRDSGPGWDFDDVRDHYVRQLFGVDPVALRYEDAERALALGRVTTGEVMARTLGEWRRAASSCRGALIWFLRDLWPGAGWGIIDANGVPKAAYYFVKRALQARALVLSDEGLNGLVADVVNDTALPLAVNFELELLRGGSVRVAHTAKSLTVPARAVTSFATADLFEHFIDVTHAYRFGPPAYDVAVAKLRDSATGEVIAENCYFPRGLPTERSDELGLEARAELAESGQWQLRLGARRFAYAVSLDVPGFIPADSYFQLAPEQERLVTLSAAPGTKPGAKPQGFARPLNAQTATRIAFDKPNG